MNLVYRFKPDQRGKACPADSGVTLPRDVWISKIQNQGDCIKSEHGVHVRLNPLTGNGVSDEDVAAYRFALLEWDDMPVGVQLTLIAKLALRIAAVITSGNKSVHAWVKIDAPDLGHYSFSVGRLYALLAPLGIDPHNKNPSRLSRFPGCERHIPTANESQRLLYLNPEPEEAPIVK